jgi:hypothetical protein
MPYPDVAVTMTLRGQGEITQDVIATFPSEVFEVDVTDQGGEILFFRVVTIGRESFISRQVLQSQLFLLVRATFSVTSWRK